MISGTIYKQIPRKKLEELTKENHQGVVAYVASYQYAELDDLFTGADARNEAPFLIILDELEDPHNLGYILRTADEIGAHGVIILKRCSVGLKAHVAHKSEETL